MRNAPRLKYNCPEIDPLSVSTSISHGRNWKGSITVQYPIWWLMFCLKLLSDGKIVSGTAKETVILPDFVRIRRWAGLPGFWSSALCGMTVTSILPEAVDNDNRSNRGYLSTIDLKSFVTMVSRVREGISWVSTEHSISWGRSWCLVNICTLQFIFGYLLRLTTWSAGSKPL